MHILPLLLLSIFVLWMKPGILLTQSRVDELFDQYAGEFFSKRPEGLGLEITSPALLRKRVRVVAKNFCLKEPDACFESVQIEAVVRVTGLPKFLLEEVGPIEIKNQHVKYTVPSPSPPSAPSSTEPSDPVLQVSNQLLIGNLDLNFPKVEVTQGREKIVGKATLLKKDSDELTLLADAQSDQTTRIFADLRTQYSLQGQSPFEANLHFQRSADKYIDGDLKGQIEWNALKGHVEGGMKIVGMIPWIRVLKVEQLKLDRKEKLHLTADLEMGIEPDIQTGSAKSALPPASLEQNLKGKLEGDEKEGAFEYLVHLGPVPHQGLLLEAKASGVYPFGPDTSSFFGLSRFFLRIEVPHIQRIVQRFRLTSFAVPAPWNTLQGSIRIQAGEVDKNLASADLPITLVTDLKSPDQAIQTDSKGTLTYIAKTGSLKIAGESHLKLIRITLPDLKLFEPIPLIKFDSRIVNEATVERKRVEKIEKNKSGNVFQWKIHGDPGAVQIFHPILRPHAPIDVHWVIGRDPSGEISLRPFEVEYLNRTAKIEHMKFYQTANSTDFNYDGRLRVEKTDYSIFIDVFKSGGKPKIQLTSSPPLGESDIISLLLFNATTAELDGDETNSVGNTQTAIANRALGIFSILALSSTPVEAVNYNATTGIYSARIKLASGLTATVGTNWDQTQEVALRKRLSKNFVLSTVLQGSDSDSTNDTRKTLIEWFKRF